MDLSTYQLDRLREESELVLYRGRDESGDAPILVLAPRSRKTEARSLGRLHHEYALTQELESPWAVKPLALTHFEGRMALVLSDPGGKLLSSHVGLCLDLRHFLAVAIGLAASLRSLHDRGLIHKDIKPANAFIDESGTVSFTGFGFATRAARERQAPGRPEVIAGTLAYLAPEQTGRVNRSIDHRSDLYALGITLYELLVGALPFTAADPTEWIYCHIARRAPSPSVRAEGVPPMIEQMIMKLLAKNAEDRYQTAAGLEYDLRRCSNDLRSHRRIETFPLATHDVSERLLIPEKLYGRDADIAVLTAAFDQVATKGKFGFVLISGYPGIGKSSVVNEMHRVLYSTRGLMAAGKFDQYKRNVPYATLAEAFQGLVRQILSKDDVDLERWRSALLNGVGANGQLMVELIPELGVILGAQPAPPSVSPQEAKNRFQLVFRRFLQVFAQPEHPLVLFLDDLQWLDSATLDFLRLLGSEEEIPYLLLIGAYRSGEGESLQRLRTALDEIRVARGALQELKLAPLTQKDVRQFVANSLHAKPASVRSLADLVFQRTRGNPFFVVQFLTALNDEGLLRFDFSAGVWRWDLDRIGTKGITDNVADLMAARLVRYKGSALTIIKLLACLGNDARAETLATLMEMSEEEVDIASRELVSAGLVYRTERGYAFPHDGVRDSAYALTTAAVRASTHLRIGKLLSEALSQRDLEDSIFEVVNHLNRGVTFITDRDERIRVAALNLMAGKRAKAATAFEAALTYLTAGRALLGSTAWEDAHRLTFDLEFHQADCQFMVGEVALAERRFEELSHRSDSPPDLSLVVSRQIMVFTTMGRMERAIEISISCLLRMGVKLDVNPAHAVIEHEYREFCDRLGGRSIESLVDLPPMQDAHVREVMNALESLLSPAGTSNLDLHQLAVLRMANLSLEHGNSDESAHAYSVLAGMVLGWSVGTFESAHSFGRLALRLVTEQKLDRHAARVYALMAGAVGPWSLPLKDCYDYAVRATEMGHEQGGITYSGYAWAVGLSALLDSGKELTDVHRQADRVLVIAQKLNFPLIVGFAKGALALVRALRGLSAAFETLTTPGFEDTEYEDHLEGAAHLWHALVRYRIRRLQLMFYAGEYPACMDLISKLEPAVNVLRVFELAEYHFFSAMARAAALADNPRGISADHFTAIVASQRQLSTWSSRCAANFADRSALVAAEVASLEGRELDAERLYEQAIRLSRENGFVQNEGLGNELAARFYLRRGFEVIAEAYLRNARSCFNRWGATAKVRQLDLVYPQLTDEAPSRAVAGLSATRIQHLDLSAVVEMHHAVSREIVLDRLIERLMVTVLEHAGAVRGLLLLQRAGDMHIVAEATGQETVAVKLQAQAEISIELPKSILNYATRTQEVIIIDDASAPNPYSADKYIRSVRPRSIMCLPLVKQKRLVGVLYLENNLSSHIFTPDRLSVLQLLASQAAISIENAQLFSDIQAAKDHARRAGDELRLSFDLIPTLAWRAASDGAVEFVNKQWHDYTGIVDATGPKWMRAFHVDDMDKVEKWRQSLEHGIAEECEGRMRRFDGEYRRFLIRATPLRDDRGDIVKWHGTNTDIEDLKRAEQAQEALARVSRITALGELTVSIAHEVNQPLMAIVTNAATCLRWLADDKPNIPEARLAAERIIRDGHRAGDVIASIRTMAKKSHPETSALDLNAVVLEVLMLTRNELDRHDIIVETDLRADIGPALGDRVQIQQVLLNLIMNGIEAINASHHQRRSITVVSKPAEPGFIEVVIADTGTGLGQTGNEEIFDVFFTTKPEGIGIGLSICRSIVEAHHGRLWAAPNTPHGSSFHFTVPTFAEDQFIEYTR